MDDALLYGMAWVFFLLLGFFFFYTIVLSKSNIPTVYFLGWLGMFLSLTVFIE